MKSIILYGSQYGTTKNYAQKLSELTGIEAVSHDKAGGLSSYGRVLYLGGLYAGGVKGLKRTAGLLPPGRELWVITVGLADVADPANIGNIRSSLKKQLPAPLYENARFFHLRGGIDYAKLSPKHRAMMWLLYKSIQKTPAEKRSAEARDLMSTYGQKVDFVDFDALRPIVEALGRPPLPGQT